MDIEKVLYNAVVCYLFDGQNFLMAIKTQKIGKGRWNGYGGGIEEGESPEEAATREIYEETDEGIFVNPLDFEKVAIIDFHNHKSDGMVFTCRVHFFFARSWSGEIRETQEMLNPTWFNQNQIPYGNLMPADRYFLPVLLSGKKIIAEFCYSSFQGELIGFPRSRYVNSFTR